MYDELVLAIRNLGLPGVYLNEEPKAYSSFAINQPGRRRNFANLYPASGHVTVWLPLDPEAYPPLQGLLRHGRQGPMRVAVVIANAEELPLVLPYVVAGYHSIAL